MRAPVAVILSLLLLPTLGLAGIAQAQPVVVSPIPIWGVVLGTIVVAGLVYLLVHAPDGRYYRYPYYGEYHRYYYNPHYRPFVGFVSVATPVIFVAPPITGVVLGVVVIDSLAYVVTRDAYGYFYRYPYYGPYRQYYYRVGYKPYVGPPLGEPHQGIPLRQGDRRWDEPAMHNFGQGMRPEWAMPGSRNPGPRDPRCRDHRSDEPCGGSGLMPHR